MDFDELQARWLAYDRKLDDALRLNVRVLRAHTMGRAASRLNPLRWWLTLELLVLAPLAIVLGSFVAGHRSAIRFLAPGTLLLVCAVGLVVAAIRQLAAMRRLDFGQPIVAVQQQLETLRIERIRATAWALVLAPLVWLPIMIVLLEGAAGVDLYARVSQAWIAANIVLGAAVAAIAVWASRRFRDRIKGSALLQRLQRDLAGDSINGALVFLAELRELDAPEQQSM